MKRQLSLILVTLMAFADTAFGGPKLKPVTSIQIRDEQFKLLRVVEDRPEIDAFFACFESGAKVCDTKTIKHGFSHKIDFNDRWLYDFETGEFALLSITVQPVYRLEGKNKALLESLLKAKDSNLPRP